VAAALLVILILAAALATGGRGAALIAAVRQVAEGAARTAGDLRALAGDHFGGLGFRVAEVRLQGASKASHDEILAAAHITRGQPILGLDLAATRARIERVGWVERARVIRLLPDTLVIAVTERPLMAVWEHQGRREVVTAGGRVTAAVNPDEFPRLPTIIGEGANTQAAAFLPLIEQMPRLSARLRAVRRVDQRRWDLLLANGTVVLLPAGGDADALRRLDDLDRSARVLDLRLQRLDLRKPDFIVARAPPAPAPSPPTTSRGA
jgi:cell division protein FtsQ